MYNMEIISTWPTSWGSYKNQMWQGSGSYLCQKHGTVNTHTLSFIFYHIQALYPESGNGFQFHNQCGSKKMVINKYIHR